MAQIDNPSGVTQAQLDSLAATIPTASLTTPPAVSDSGAVGSDTMMYAKADHTHASKARKARMTSATDGTIIWTFATPFPAGVVPRCYGQAVTAVGVTDVINVQTEGEPTNTGVKMRVNRTNKAAVSLIGLTILSVPSSPGATTVDLLALEP